MPQPVTREEALRTLGLPASAGAADLKRAYRRLARQHHPDLGGEPHTFHRLRRAYERLADDLADGMAPPTVQRGRPSRPHRMVVDDEVDLGSVDWSEPSAHGARYLDRSRLARLLARAHPGPVHPVTAASRAPRSRLNRFAAALASDLTSRLVVRPAVDDRARVVVAVEVRATNRRARRALDRVALDGVWVRTRTSTSTTLRWAAAPSGDRRATSLRIADRLEALCTALAWPLPAWTLTGPVPEPES